MLALAGGMLVIPPGASAFTTAQADPTAPVNRSVGRLFINSQLSGTSKCSAAVVDAPNQSTLLTAGHCLSTAADGPTVSAKFIPGYQDGAAPFGTWTSARFVQAPQWNGVFNRRYDYGFVIVDRNPAGVPVEDVVGGLPLAFNQARDQAYRILGLPGEPLPYDGERLWACETAYAGDLMSDPGPGPLRISAECDFGVGASGGPWIGAGGAVASVSSTKGATTLRAPYFDNDAAALFQTAGTISTAPPVKKKKCKKKKKKGKKRALAAKKKCKKKKKKRKR
jgi:hypothetical protein